MKQYTFYPGCAYDSSGLPIRFSIEATNPLMDIELLELEDWTCCGASAADTSSRLLSLALPARNLALAARTGKKADFLVGLLSQT